MIKNTIKLCNQYGTDIIGLMNQCDKGRRLHECNINFSNCNYRKGYFNLLATALELETFTWEDLLMNSYARENVIRKWERSISYFSRRGEYVSLHKYATNYLNSYKAFFRNYNLIETVKGKPRGTMQITWLGKSLVKALYAKMK